MLLVFYLNHSGPRQSSSSITWTYPVRHPTSDAWHYCLPLSSPEFLGTLTRFPLTLPTVFSSGPSYLRSFAVVSPKALFLPLPSFWVLVIFQHRSFQSLLFCLCVSIVFLLPKGCTAAASIRPAEDRTSHHFLHLAPFLLNFCLKWNSSSSLQN